MGEFIEASTQSILSDLYARYPAPVLQEAAWSSTLDRLKVFFRDYLEENPGSKDWRVLFEYQMPRARDRPLDVCVLGGDCVAVVEVKDSDSASMAAVDQLRGYVRDLREYHVESRNRSVRGAVWVMGSSGTREVDGTVVGDVSVLPSVFEGCASDSVGAEEAEDWMRSRFEPLPSLVESALRIFEGKPLPQIRTVDRAEIGATVEYVTRTAARAKEDGENHLILLTGVPGSGKTLVGLQAVHEFTREDRSEDRGLFLSGNAPLIEVLQYQLESSVFVQNIHGFISEYAVSEETPDEHLYVFDEAQRAWDQDHVVRQSKKKKRDLPPNSEPEILLEVLGRRSEGSCLVAVIGEGQSIYKGEQGGLGLWSKAMNEVESSWKLHLPPNVRDELEVSSLSVEPCLHLSQTVRAHRATRMADWIEAMFQARTEEASEIARELSSNGFWMRITRDLDEAKEHIKGVYEGEETKTYGMVGSSKARDLAEYGVDLGYVGAHWLRPGQRGPWYVDRDGKRAQCRELIKAAQEFQCQGLELDGTLVWWGRDLTRQEGEWISRAKHVDGIRDPHELRINAYRVLLSRARDGMILFLPRKDEMEETAQHLITCGVRPL